MGLLGLIPKPAFSLRHPLPRFQPYCITGMFSFGRRSSPCGCSPGGGRGFVGPGGLTKPSLLLLWPVWVTITQTTGFSPDESSLETGAAAPVPPGKTPRASEGRGEGKTKGMFVIKGERLGRQTLCGQGLRGARDSPHGQKGLRKKTVLTRTCLATLRGHPPLL